MTSEMLLKESQSSSNPEVTYRHTFHHGIQGLDPPSQVCLPMFPTNQLNLILCHFDFIGFSITKL